jgi:hypothetical protein
VSYSIVNAHAATDYVIPVREEVFFDDGWRPMLPNLDRVRIARNGGPFVEVPMDTLNDIAALEDEYGHPLCPEMLELIDRLGNIADGSQPDEDDVRQMRLWLTEVRRVYCTFKHKVRVGENEDLDVKTSVTSYVGQRGFYLYQLYFPTAELDLHVYHPADIDVRAQLLHPRPDALESADSTRFHKRWEIRAGIFPHQGICLDWCPLVAVP